MTAATAPYGTWDSPITPAVVAAARHFGTVLLHDGRAYWHETRPEDGGRGTVCRRDLTGGPVEDLTPEADVRSRVHEYGGGDFTLAGDTLYYVEHTDQQVYRQRPGRPRPERLTAPPVQDEAWRYADLHACEEHGVLLAVRERHRPGHRLPDNDLVRIDPDGAVTPIATGHDFYAAARTGPGGAWLCWLSWDLPAMPWDRTSLWLAPFDDPAAAVLVAGGTDAILQPRFGPDGSLYYLSDESGHWNLYRRGPGGRVERVVDLPYDCARPPWQLGTQSYGFLDGDRLVFTYHREGRDRLAVIGGDGRPVDVDVPLTDVGDTLATGPGTVLCAGATPYRPSTLTMIDLTDVARPALTTLRAPVERPVPEAVVSEPGYLGYDAGDGTTGHAILNLPKNDAYQPSGTEPPPLIVTVHGGPTSHVTAAYLPSVQYWTSRGFAHLAVNYAGSSGYGRAYRRRLDGRWGVADVQDVIAACRHLAAAGLVDERRIAVRGGSAGGYTALAALAFTDYFAAGASYYGITDLELLARSTHKFEAGYLDVLVGPLPGAVEVYRARSPRTAAGHITVPLALFAGAQDAVAPLSQAVEMSQELTTRGVPHVFRVFGGEDHGFRTAASVSEALALETDMYAAAFGLPVTTAPRR